MCEHLLEVENYLKTKGIAELWRGQPWTDNCREWVYYDCILNTTALQSKLKLANCIIPHENADPRSGTEYGLVCTICKDGVMGFHPDDDMAKTKVLII